jgi:hypothetical protein
MHPTVGSVILMAKCPKCGSTHVYGGIGLILAIFVIVGLTMGILPGLILWYVWTEKTCLECGLKWR